MSKEKKPYVSPDEKLEMEFDYFIKKTIEYVTRDVLGSYAGNLERREREPTPTN